MHTFIILISSQLRTLKNSFALKTLKSGRTLLIGLFLIGYLVGAFEGFLYGFSFLKAFPVIGMPIITNLWFFFFFILFLMLIFSNAAIFYSFFYHKKEHYFLFSMPIPDSSILAKWFFECLVLSSWGFLFLSGPLIISLGFVMHASFYFYLFAAVFLFLFLVMTTSIGFFCALGMVMLPRKRRSILLFALFSGFFFYLLFFVLRMPDFIGGGEWPFIAFMTNFFKKIDVSQRAYLPSAWVARSLWGILTGNAGETIVFGQLLCMSACTFFLCAILWGSSRLLPACSRRQDMSVKKNKTFFSPLCRTQNIIWQIACKDFKLFFRDPGQYVQFIIIIALVILYATNLRGLADFIDRRFWRITIYFMNISALSLTAAAMAIRFLFPQLSLEGKRFWLLGLAPIKRYQFVIGKALPGLIIIMLSTGSIMVYANIMMETTFFLTICALLILCLVIISLGSLAFGMGMIYPDFKSEDPTRIISGFGGILTLLVSMLYIALVIPSVAVPIYRFLFRRYFSYQAFLWTEIVSCVGIVIISLGCCIIPLRYGMKRLFLDERF